MFVMIRYLSSGALRLALAPNPASERESDRLGSDCINDERIRRPRHAPWRPALGAVSTRIRCDGEIDASPGLEHGGPWLVPQRDTRDRPGRTVAAKGTKKPPPRSGDERCQARGTTPLCGRIASGHLSPHGAMTRDAAAR